MCKAILNQSKPCFFGGYATGGWDEDQRHPKTLTHAAGEKEGHSDQPIGPGPTGSQPMVTADSITGHERALLAAAVCYLTVNTGAH